MSSWEWRATLPVARFHENVNIGFVTVVNIHALVAVKEYANLQTMGAARADRNGVIRRKVVGFMLIVGA